jgi:hypothetical protein
MINTSSRDIETMECKCFLQKKLREEIARRGNCFDGAMSDVSQRGGMVRKFWRADLTNGPQDKILD